MSTQNIDQAGKPSPGEGRVGEGPGVQAGQGPGAKALRDWPLWEVFVRSKQGLEHKHCGSLHASDSQHALQMARDVYTRRQEGVSIWVVPSHLIAASDPSDKDQLFEPASDKVYRHPTFYDIPDEVGHM